MDELIKLLSQPATLILALVALLLVAAWLGFDIGWDGSKPQVSRRPKRENAQMNVAFERLADTGKGLRAVLEANTADVDETLSRWFAVLCTSVAWTLATNNSERYRVAIWVKDPENDDQLRAIGWHLFEGSRPGWGTLDRKTSLAGLAMDRREPYYCRDVSKDPRYVRRSPRPNPPDYGSVLAIPLGDDDPWGAMTIDAKSKNGFTDLDQVIAVRFGDLASIGAGVGSMRRRNGG